MLALHDDSSKLSYEELSVVASILGEISWNFGELIIYRGYARNILEVIINLRRYGLTEMHYIEQT